MVAIYATWDASARAVGLTRCRRATQLVTCSAASVRRQTICSIRAVGCTVVAAVTYKQQYQYRDYANEKCDSDRESDAHYLSHRLHLSAPGRKQEALVKGSCEVAVRLERKERILRWHGRASHSFQG